MRYLKQFKSFLFILLICSNCYAAESYIKNGMDLDKISQSRLISLGHHSKLINVAYFNYFNWMSEIGFWTRSQSGRVESSGFGSIQLGVDIEASPFTASTFHGIGAITKTDSRLGSNFQFFHDLCGGLQDDKNHANISLCYKHISNAGVTLPNLGKDFIMIKIGIPY